MENAVRVHLEKENARGATLAENLDIGGAFTSVDSTLGEVYTASLRAAKIIALQLRYIVYTAERALSLCKCRRTFRVAVIGCGHVGSAAVQELLDAGFPPEQLLLSSRRTDTDACELLREQGVVCEHDNATVSERARVVLVACLPSHMRVVMSSLAGRVRNSSIFCSVVPGYSTQKLAKLLRRDSSTLILRMGMQIPVALIPRVLGTEPTEADVARLAAECLGIGCGGVDVLFTCLQSVCQMSTDAPKTDADAVTGFSVDRVVSTCMYGLPNRGKLDSESLGQEYSRRFVETIVGEPSPSPNGKRDG